MCSRSYKLISGIALSILSASLSAMEQPQLENMEVYIGSMCSGKTTAVIDEIWEARLSRGQSAVMFKFNPSMGPEAPSRATEIFSHEDPFSKTKKCVDGFEVLNTRAIRDLLSQANADVIGMDEGQFADEEVFPFIQELLGKGKKLIVAGLYYDFRHKAFGNMPKITAMSKLIKLFSARCAKCGEDADYSQRLDNGEPAKADDQTIVLDGERAEITYEPRCEKCYVSPEGITE